jgi:hypothetical protein
VAWSKLTEIEQIRAKGRLGDAQRKAHMGLEGPTFTTGTLNFPEHLLAGVDDVTADEIAAVLAKARKDICIILGESMVDAQP